MLSISSNTQGLITRLSELVKNLKYLDSLKNNSQINVEKINFVTPLSIAPVAASINSKNLKYNFVNKNSSYLQTICFPEGIDKIEQITNQKTYLPIIHLILKNLEKTALSNLLGKLHMTYLDLLKANIIADKKFLELITNNTFGFLLGEMLDNIEEHSKAENIYLFAQYWKKLNACEICIIDDGVGIFESLKKAGRDVKDHMDALKQVLETGLSSKTEFGDIKRGTGIRNTRLAITNKDIHGEFLIITGNAAFMHSATEGSRFVNLTDYRYQGTIVMLRLNEPPSKFNLYNYVR